MGTPLPRAAHRRLPTVALLLGGLALVVWANRPPARPAGEAGAEPAPSVGAGLAPASAHACALATGWAGWCETCDLGDLAGLRIESRALFDALDAHGHEVDPASIECTTCRAGLADGGFCDACRMGFVDGRAYLSRLTYHLARGRVVAPSAIACPTCRRHAEGTGWCDACPRGWVGHVAFADRAEHARTAELHADVVRATELAATCETCAAAFVLGGTCPRCRIDWGERAARAEAGR